MNKHANINLTINYLIQQTWSYVGEGRGGGGFYTLPH